METTIPSIVQPLLEAYLKALEPLQPKLYGIYLYGSIAIAAFEEQTSDIDVIALTQGEWTATELAQLDAIHEELKQKYPLGKRLEVIYVPLSGLGKGNDQIAPYPCVRDGKFSPAAHGNLSAVTWWMLKDTGVSVLGPERSALPLEVQWQDVRQAMRYNLETYWAGKAKRPWLFLSDYWVMFGVSTLCRILSAIEEGEIISKAVALSRWRDRLPARFQLLIDETVRLRQRQPAPSPYHSRLKRMKDTLEFIRYARERGAKALSA